MGYQPVFQGAGKDGHGYFPLLEGAHLNAGDPHQAQTMPGLTRPPLLARQPCPPGTVRAEAQ
jgi:hypothetical protein